MKTSKKRIDYTNLEMRASGRNCNLYACGFYETVIGDYGQEMFIEYSFEEALALVVKGTHEFSEDALMRMTCRLSGAPMPLEEAMEFEKFVKELKESSL